MKILNLYCGIGGNRRLWGNEHDIVGIENNPKIAKIYQDFFPQDTVIVADAHQYLLEHFGEFDFIWSSPPCPSHSKCTKANVLSPYKDNSKQLAHGGGIAPRYPDLKLYEEIIFLRNFLKGKYCVENVIAYYEPLIRPTETHRHWFWANFHIRDIKLKGDDISNAGNKTRAVKLGFDISKYNIGIRKDKILRNCVQPNLGLHILNESKRDVQPELFRKSI